MENIPQILVNIHQQYPNLTGNEQALAKFVLEHPEKIPEMRIHDLAHSVGVANSAVIRFCKALGFSGYSEFKFHMSSENTSLPETYILPSISKKEDTAGVFHKIFLSNIHSMYNTLHQLDFAAAAKAVDLMKSANRILFVGTGSSEPLVNDGVYQLMQLGYQAISAVNGVTMRISAMNMQPGDVAIGISYCGHTIDTVEALHLAHEQGASTIAITCYSDSPLCKHADILLLPSAEEIPYLSDGALTSSRTSIMCIIESLIISLGCKDYDQSLSKIHMRNTQVFPNIRI